MGAKFCRSADTSGALAADYAASRLDDGDNESTSLLQPYPLHRGSILGITDSALPPLGGVCRRAVFTCSDDKRIAVVEESYETGKESQPLSWVPCTTQDSSPCHDKAVHRLAAGGGSLFSCSRDLSVKQWRISNGEDDSSLTSLSLLRSFDKAHELMIADIAVSCDGSVVCSGSRDYSVKVWDVASGKCAQEYRTPRNVVTSLELGAHSSLLYQGSEDLCVRVWDSRAPARQPAVHITGYVYFPLCLALRPDQTVLATGCKGFDSNGCEVKLWDLRSPERCLADYKGHSMDVTAVRYSSAGALYSVSKDGSIFAWNGLYTGDDSESAHVACIKGTGRYFTSLVAHGGSDGSAALLVGAFDGSLSRYRCSGDSAGLRLQAATPPHFAAAEYD